MSGRDSPNGKLGLGEVVPAGSLGVGKRLADDVLKVGVHVGMRARNSAKEKLRRSGAPRYSGLY